MASVTTARMTAEEFYDWVHRPENRDRSFELEAGEVVEMPSPGERHGAVCMNVGALLWMCIRQRKQGYVTSNDAGIVLERDPDTVRGPDIAVYLAAVKYQELNPKYSERVPALVVEVQSPTDRFSRMVKRINEFLARGVPLVWLLDPEVQSVMIWRPQQPQIVLEGEAELTGYEVLPEFRCKVSEFLTLPG